MLRIHKGFLKKFLKFGFRTLAATGRCELPADLQNTSWSLLTQHGQDVLVLAEDDSDDALNVMLSARCS